MKKVDPTPEQALFRAVYNKKNTLPNVILLEDESIHKFMEEVPHGHKTIQDINQVREWKNKLVKIRDSQTDIELYKVFDEELVRVVNFLNNDVFKDL